MKYQPIDFFYFIFLLFFFEQTFSACLNKYLKSCKGDYLQLSSYQIKYKHAQNRARTKSKFSDIKVFRAPAFFLDYWILYFESVILGGLGQRQVRVIHGTENRCSGLRLARGHRGGQTQDGHDCVRLPHGQGLRPQHGQQKTLRHFKILILNCWLFLYFFHL